MYRIAIIIFSLAALIFIGGKVYTLTQSQDNKIKGIRGQFGTFQSYYNDQPNRQDATAYHTWENGLYRLDSNIRSHIAEIDKPKRDTLLSELTAIERHLDSLSIDKLVMQGQERNN